MRSKTRKSSNIAALISASAIILILSTAIPARAQYDIYDLGYKVTTQDIQADNTNTVHIVWTYGGILYYGKIVNNAITGRVQVATGVNTIFWRPYVSVQPDGSSVHIAWTTAGMGNMLMHSWKTTGNWTSETVLTVPTTQWLSQATCAVDSSGIVHVMFSIWNSVSTNEWSTIFYRRKLADGNWEGLQQFAPLTPEHKHPMLFVDSSGQVHATWDISGNLGSDSYDAYYCTAPSGGMLAYANTVKIPKAADCNVHGYGDLYVDRNGVVHRSIGGWSNAVRKMCIEHTKKPVGGSFQTPTRPSLGFLNLGGGDPVPAVVAIEDGKVVVAWGQIGADGSNTVKASFYDPEKQTWSLNTIDPAAGIPTGPNAYRVALTRTTTQLFGVWRGSNGNLKLFVMPFGTSWRIDGTGDFNGDGKTDILWRYYGPEGYDVVWFMSYAGGSSLQAFLQPLTREEFQTIRVVDMHKGRTPQQVFRDAREGSGLKGEPQLVFRNPMGTTTAQENGGQAIQEMPLMTDVPVMGWAGDISAAREQGSKAMSTNGFTYIGLKDLPAVTDPNWKIAGTGDFNGDGKVDILWRYQGPGGYNLVWYMNGGTYLDYGYLPSVTDENWQIVGTGDFNRDGSVDILWRHYGPDGQNVVWYMNGGTYLDYGYLPAVTDENWQIVGTGDFNRDGSVDILWRHYGPDGQNVVWYMSGGTYFGSDALPSVTGSTWEIAAADDFNGDGKVDILWRYYGAGGYNLVWYMDGVAMIGLEFLPSVI